LTGDMVYLMPADIDSYINNGYKANVHVYSVVNAIANRATGIPLQFEQNEKIKDNAKVLDLLKRPNPMQSWDDFLKAAIIWNRLTGNCYIYKIAPDAGLNAGKPVELWLLPAHLVEIVSGGITAPVKGYRIRIGAGIWKDIPAEQVIHWKEFNPDYNEQGAQLYGQSPLQAGLLTIGASNDGYKALNKAFQNGAPAGILTGTADAGLEYTPEQIERINERWAKKYGGVDNYMKVIFSRNPLNWVKMGYSVIDMNVIESMKYTLQDICNLYQVPIHLFNSDAATLDNYKEARKAIYTDAVIPMLDQLLLQLNTFLVPDFKEPGLLTYSTTVIPELNQDFVTHVTALAQAWWLTGNEKRVQMGLTEVTADPLMNTILYPSSNVPGLELGMGNPDDLSL